MLGKACFKSLIENGHFRASISAASIVVKNLNLQFRFHREGEPVKDFRGAWDNSSAEVGLKGRTLHDLRRSALRNMVRGGIPEKIAMKISGHQTRSIFKRYNISSQEDLKKAARKQDAYGRTGRLPFVAIRRLTVAILWRWLILRNLAARGKRPKFFNITGAWDRNRTGIVGSNEGF